MLRCAHAHARAPCSVKRIVQTRIPNLGTVEDISEYVLFGGGAASSESEFEVRAGRCGGDGTSIGAAIASLLAPL